MVGLGISQPWRDPQLRLLLTVWERPPDQTGLRFANAWPGVIAGRRRCVPARQTARANAGSRFKAGPLGFTKHCLHDHIGRVTRPIWTTRPRPIARAIMGGVVGSSTRRRACCLDRLAKQSLQLFTPAREWRTGKVDAVSRLKPTVATLRAADTKNAALGFSLLGALLGLALWADPVEPAPASHRDMATLMAGLVTTSCSAVPWCPPLLWRALPTILSAARISTAARMTSYWHWALISVFGR